MNKTKLENIVPSFFIAKNTLTLLQTKDENNIKAFNLLLSYVNRHYPHNNCDSIIMYKKSIFPKTMKVSAVVNEIFDKEGVSEDSTIFKQLRIGTILGKKIKELTPVENRMLYLFTILCQSRDLYILDDPCYNLSTEDAYLVTSILEKVAYDKTIVAVSATNRCNFVHNVFSFEDNKTHIYTKDKLIITQKNKPRKFYSKKVLSIENLTFSLISFLTAFILAVLVFVVMGYSNISKRYNDQNLTNHLYESNVSLNAKTKNTEMTYDMYYDNINRSLDSVKGFDGKMSPVVSYDVTFPIYTQINNSEINKIKLNTIFQKNILVDPNLDNDSIQIPKEVFYNFFNISNIKSLDDSSIVENNYYIIIKENPDSDVVMKLKIAGLTNNSSYIVPMTLDKLFELNNFNTTSIFDMVISPLVPNLEKVIDDIKRSLNFSVIEYNEYQARISRQYVVSEQTITNCVDGNVYAYSVDGSNYIVSDRNYFNEKFYTNISTNTCVATGDKSFLDNIDTNNTIYSGLEKYNSTINALFYYNISLRRLNNIEDYSQVYFLLKDYSSVDKYKEENKDLANFDINFNNEYYRQEVSEYNNNDTFLAKHVKVVLIILIVMSILFICLLVLDVYIYLMAQKYYFTFHSLGINFLLNKSVWTLITFVLVIAVVFITTIGFNNFAMTIHEKYRYFLGLFINVPINIWTILIVFTFSAIVHFVNIRRVNSWIKNLKK